MLYAFFLATQVNINESSENICKHTWYIICIFRFKIFKKYLKLYLLDQKKMKNELVIIWNKLKS